MNTAISFKDYVTGLKLQNKERALSNLKTARSRKALRGLANVNKLHQSMCDLPAEYFNWSTLAQRHLSIGMKDKVTLKKWDALIGRDATTSFFNENWIEVFPEEIDLSALDDHLVYGPMIAMVNDIIRLHPSATYRTYNNHYFNEHAIGIELDTSYIVITYV